MEKDKRAATAELFFFLFALSIARRVSQKSTIELKQGGDGGCWAITSQQAGLSSAGRSYVTSGCVRCAGLRVLMCIVTTPATTRALSPQHGRHSTRGGLRRGC